MRNAARRFLLLCVFSCSSSHALGAIVHTPGFTIVPLPPPGSPPVVQEIDLNGDSLPEFSIRTKVAEACVCLPGDPLPPYFSASLGFEAGATNQSFIHLPTSLAPSNPAALPADFLIGPGDWFRSQPNTLFHAVTENLLSPPVPTDQGNFAPFLGTRYLGVQFDLNSTTHYGWVALSVRLFSSIFDPGHIVIGGYAYDTTGAPLLAGQTETMLFADEDDDGDVDLADLIELQRRGGSTAELAAWEAQFAGQHLSGTHPVPEPASLFVTLLGGVFFLSSARPLSRPAP